ncbi:unnamed protein product [Mytilus coruscus]|uniref:Novel acetylcholine receptor chaperone n=1 Tax=Mytilus coruscus TaxID=42192 RepID=A0A6J8DQQ1_MYTCO|nr:unnamed protein product [Mytilus coruscus]
MTAMVLKALSVTLGIFFVFVGSLKLTPSLSDELYKEMRKNYIQQVRVFPPVKLFKWKLSPHIYRKAIGGAETLCGVILAFIPGPLKGAANVLMILITMNDVYCHWMLNSPLDKMSLSIVFFFLLMCRLIIFLQFKAKEMEETKGRKQEVSSEKKEE